MNKTGTLSGKDRIKDADALFKGANSPGHSGYFPMASAGDRENKPSAAPQELYPGLLDCMAASHPFKHVFTCGDMGLFNCALNFINNRQPGNLNSQVIAVEEEEFNPPAGIEKLLIADIHKDYDTPALDRVLSGLKEENPHMQPFLFKGETIEPQFKKKYKIEQLPFTWPDYLDDKMFYGYYRQRLTRLFKETRRWPFTPGFKGRRRDLEQLEKALRENNYVHADGLPGVGKTALIAKLAQRAARSKRPVIWVTIDSPGVPRAEILISLGIQMGLVEDPHFLEKAAISRELDSLEKKIREKLDNENILVVVDSLDSLFKRFNGEVQNLLTTWITPNAFFNRGNIPDIHLVFIGDLRLKERGEDPYKRLKNDITQAVRQRGYKIWVNELSPQNRKALLKSWLAPLSPVRLSEAEEKSMLEAAGRSLRLLRLLAMWACVAGGVAKILPKLEDIKKTRPIQKEKKVLSAYLKKAAPQKKVILDTLEWIGKPVQRQVLCSSPGMAMNLDQLVQDRLVIFNPEENTYEPVYRHGTWRHTMEGDRPEVRDAFAKEIRTIKRLGNITNEENKQTALEYYWQGNAICTQTGNWQPWEGAPVIYAQGLISRAEFLVRKAKKSSSQKIRQELARQAMELGNKCINMKIELQYSHFVYAQAMELVYLRSHDKDIKEHYEIAIRLKSHVSKYVSYARFLYRRLKDYEGAEAIFKKVENMEKRRGKVNTIGLRAFADFYLDWHGHGKDAGDVLNRIIDQGQSRYRNYFLAGRIFQSLEWRFLTRFFYKEALREKPGDIQTLNSYANACAEWGNKEKAEELFERALKLESKNVQVLNSYANACAEWGKREKAEELFERALHLAPDDVILLKSYTHALVKWKEAAKAKPWQEKLKSIKKAGQEKAPAPQPGEVPSKIAAPTPIYGIETTVTPTSPQSHPETASPSQPGTPSTAEFQPAPGEENPFTLTPEEKAWLLETTAEPLRLPDESARWAGFTMLYSLYYWETELSTFIDLGIRPPLQRDYERMFNIVTDLRQMTLEAANPDDSKPHAPYTPDISYENEWFLRFLQKGPSEQKIDYYDHQMLLHPENPVCAALLCHALQAKGWANTAKILKKQVLTWVKPYEKEWKPYLDISSAQLETPAGKDKFQTFIREQKQLFARQESDESGEFTSRKAADFLNRFTISWREMPRYFPWEAFTPFEINLMLGKLTDILTRLQQIMAGIKARNQEDLEKLRTVLKEISPLDNFMERLSQTVNRLNKPEPIPLYVSGEIKEMTATHLVVTVENSDCKDRELTIPRQEFPHENSSEGQHYFAAVKEEQPDKLLNIELMPLRKERSFDELFISLFGEETYGVVSARWKGEGEEAS